MVKPSLAARQQLQDEEELARGGRSLPDGSDASESGVDSSTTKQPGVASTINGDNTTKGGESSSESSTLAKQETRAVARSKMLVLLVLLLAAIGTGIATYIFAHNTETKEFESKVSKLSY